LNVHQKVLKGLMEKAEQAIIRRTLQWQPFRVAEAMIPGLSMNIGKQYTVTRLEFFGATV
jgi:hypothetical protein